MNQQPLHGVDDGPPILVDRPATGVTRLRLNRPALRNAVDAATVAALANALNDVSDNVVVLGSTSPSAFCSGADLTVDDDERAAISDSLYQLYRQMLDTPIIIISSINGAAVGAGAQLAVASDLRIGSPAARFRFAGPGHGLAVGAWALPSLVGRGRAADLCLSMRWVGADEALAIGLLERVVDDVEAKAVRAALDISRLEAGAVRRTKRLLTNSGGLCAFLDEERIGNRLAWSGSIAGLVGDGDPNDG